MSHINFQIYGTEKIAVVGKNGAGKTTLLRLTAGELSLGQDDRHQGPGIICSRQVTIGMLSQQVFSDTDRTVQEESLSSCPCKDSLDRGRFEYEREYDILLTGLGFSKEDKERPISHLSGGEQIKTALIRLLLGRSDILLLDESTNHLDTETREWLERYMERYEKTVVMASHDHSFPNRTVEAVYELSYGSLTRYPGNYTHYKEKKGKRIRPQKKAYEKQQEGLERLGGLVEHLEHRPNKAASARAKRKTMDRMERVEQPLEEDTHTFTGEIIPEIPGSKRTFASEHLKIGYGKALLEATIRIRRGQKIAILGSNGVGKTIFLKTTAGFIPSVEGEFSLGNNTTIGYFDQQAGTIQADCSVFEHFTGILPSLTQKEARSILGSYLFSGREAEKRVVSLSGGEKSRPVSVELLQSRSNFLILDGPTNHMDIQAEGNLESAFRVYTGTILFVSHDRYFIRQVADAVLILENRFVIYYPFDYEHYLERKNRVRDGAPIAAQTKAEEQALIAGMRAVPKAECHQLKKFSIDVAYKDQKMGPVLDRPYVAREEMAAIATSVERMYDTWTGSKAFWDGGGWQEKGEYESLCCRYKESWERWHGSCMEWLEAAEETGVYEGWMTRS